MWYFAWILGLGLACSFGILNAMWYEMRDDRLGGAETLVDRSPRAGVSARGLGRS